MMPKRDPAWTWAERAAYQAGYKAALKGAGLCGRCRLKLDRAGTYCKQCCGRYKTVERPPKIKRVQDGDDPIERWVRKHGWPV